MRALQEFFTTDVGLMSAAVIAVTIGIGIYFSRFIARHVREDAARAARESRER